MDEFEQTLGGVKYKVTSLFEINPNKNYSKLIPFKKCLVFERNQRKLKMKKQSKDKMMRNIRNLFRLQKEDEAIKARIVSKRY